MIPSVVARQVRETVLDYLRTTFALADPEFECALFDFLDGEEGLFKGPYVDIRLPFRKAEAGERIPLEIRPGFEPYKHQLKALQRLYSKDGHQPQHTLVTTGTGSGKTECFLYPALDHCWRNRGEPGVKAILLYPMNALASDQARRLAQMLWDDERLRGKVMAGLYVGGKGQHGAADREHLVDDRNVLRASPPDILLTNYKMLDFLLLRPEDRRLWQHNGPDTLRYLVLDELHTYDGAQGSDVACLIRRLKRRLGCAPGSVCSIGTSATIGGGMRRETIQALTGFASKVFDEDFFEDSVVTEDRLDAVETLGETVNLERLPRPDQIGELEPEAHSDSGAWLRRQAELWLGDDAGGVDAVEIGKRLERHDFLRQILKVLGGSLKSWPELDAGLLPRVPEWETFEPAGRQRLLESFLGLVSHARRLAPSSEDPHRTEPFLAVQAQLWLRELRHLLRKVLPATTSPAFAWVDDGIRNDGGEAGYWLPIAHCRECGSAGLAAFQRESEQVLRTDLQSIGRNWLNRNRTCRYVVFGHAGDPEGFPEYLCPGCLRVQPGGGSATCDHCKMAAVDGGDGEPLAMTPIRLGADVSDGKPPRFLQACPDCGAEGTLRMLGSRAPSLLSVAISHLYQSDYNDDKKLLAFTDSVQDASHRAGFFGARTYRFNLRTAMQSVVEASEEEIPLQQLSERMWGFWSEQMGQAKLIPTLLPSDLRELPTYARFLERGGVGTHRELEDQLRERLSWEAVLEYGLNTRVGRTLETTLCSTVTVDRDALSQAAESLALELRENTMLDAVPEEGFSEGALEHLLTGVLHRLRTRGGIDHPLLRSYVREGGNRWFLTKRKQPLMSPFGRESVLPRFLTDRTRASGESPVFDTFVSKPDRLTWYRDWASRVLGVDRKDDGLNDLYREAVKRLEDAGILVSHELKKRGHVWGIDPGRLRVTPKVGQVGCPECRRRVTLATSEMARWSGRPCTQYRCSGCYEPAHDHEQTYYGRIYRSGRLERIFTHEHTGLLGREARERVEEAFAEGTSPGAPNLLVCTPTLEMGIDIGDLSAAMLCSVPPTTPNYLQRIGRTGRKTGNAFCLTLANSRPHDLYFHTQPMEMMAGQVLPPGCFLDAPEMLRRQIVAHAMDAWARQEEEVKSIPSQTGFILGDAGRRGFPGRFLEFYRENRDSLTETFLSCFGDYLSSTNRERLFEFATGDLVPQLVNQAFEQIETERKELRNLQDRAKKRIQEIENNPESVEDPEAEKADLDETRKLVGRLMVELSNKYPLNVLTDEGILPNYAFPEPGVKLESVVSQVKQDGQREYEAREYMRPASTAIRELAPFNTFYADGRKVRIDEIDIGSKARPLLETWRLCQECSYMRLEYADQPIESECPRCADSNWSDAGQARTLVHFRRSRSLATRLEASTTDDTDDREEAFYELLALIDVGPEHYNGAKLIEELPFGYELLKNLKLREINFGLDVRAGQQGFRVCGQPIGEKGFDVCLECGRVRGRDNKIHHNPACKARKTGVQEKTGAVFLYREIQSEAIRILLPVSEVGLEPKRASFKAALQLGFRRHFEGDPGHLIVGSVREPIPRGYGTRQYLVVFDGVPGGTGYLSELWQEGHFLDVLQKALAALQACVCQQDPNRDGCYRCLFAYQSQRELPLISSREAQETLRAILEKRDSLTSVHTLSEVSLESKLESELETKFLEALRARAESTKGLSWEEKVQGGELCWILRAGQQAWEIRAQVDLGPAEGVVPACRPDFMIRPANADPAIRPVAVFCDGLAYHACPGKDQGRIADDIQKRKGILHSGKYAVWSVSWKDVGDFEQSPNKTTAPQVFGGLNHGKLGQVGQGMGLALDRVLGQRGSMEMLLAYLQQPDVVQWENLASTYAVIWLSSVPQWLSPVAGGALESRLESETERFDTGPMAQVGPDAPVLTRHEWQQWFAALARSSRSSLQKGKVDRWVLRIFDEKGAREDSGFESCWRSFLHAWNLLQFHQNVEVISSELLEQSPYVEAAQPEAQAAEAPDAAASGKGVDPEFLELLDLATVEARPLIQGVYDAGLPWPMLDYELPTTAGSGPEADLSWPELQVAVLAERQLEDLPVFEAAGWNVFKYPLDSDDLIRVLKDREGHHSGTRV